MPRAGTLPNDIETLKRLLLERTAALEVAQALLLSRQQEIEQLKLQIARLRRMHFGRSSEALDEQIRQLEFKLEELESEEASLPVPAPTPLSAASPYVGHCRSACRASAWCMSPRPPVRVLSAAGCCVRSVRMSPRCSSTCRST